MEAWHPVIASGAVGTVPSVVPLGAAGTDRVLLVRDPDGALHATQAVCPHLGNPLTDAEVEGGRLVCSHHRYGYRLVDGVCDAPGGPLAGRLGLHDVRERDGTVEVRLRPAPGSHEPTWADEP